MPSSHPPLHHHFDLSITTTNTTTNNHNHNHISSNGNKTPIPTPITYPELRSEFAHHDPSVVRINNGSFGSCPASVTAAQRRWQLKWLQQPDDFYYNQLKPSILRTRNVIKDLINADDVDEISVVDNATTAAAIVLQHTSWAFAEGREVDSEKSTATSTKPEKSRQQLLQLVVDLQRNKSTAATSVGGGSSATSVDSSSFITLTRVVSSLRGSIFNEISSLLVVEPLSQLKR